MILNFYHFMQKYLRKIDKRLRWKLKQTQEACKSAPFFYYIIHDIPEIDPGRLHQFAYVAGYFILHLHILRQD